MVLYTLDRCKPNIECMILHFQMSKRTCMSTDKVGFKKNPHHFKEATLDFQMPDHSPHYVTHCSQYKGCGLNDVLCHENLRLESKEFHSLPYSKLFRINSNLVPTRIRITCRDESHFKSL